MPADDPLLKIIDRADADDPEDIALRISLAGALRETFRWRPARRTRRVAQGDDFAVRLSPVAALGRTEWGARPDRLRFAMPRCCRYDERRRHRA